jgi:hypothetical protein
MPTSELTFQTLYQCCKILVLGCPCFFVTFLPIYALLSSFVFPKDVNRSYGTKWRWGKSLHLYLSIYNLIKRLERRKTPPSIIPQLARVCYKG